MSNAIFPVLPGLTWSVVKSPEWSTAIQRSRSGKEVRAAYFSRPIWHFSLSYEFLRGGAGFTELQQLLGFFNARMGSFDSFLFTDPSDNTVTAQVIGTGNGSQTDFVMTHTIGGVTEPIGYSTTETVFVNGVQKTFGTDFGADGEKVIFTSPPANGAVITWTGSFYYRVRFAKDSMDFDQFMKDLWQLKKCDLIGVI